MSKWVELLIHNTCDTVYCVVILKSLTITLTSEFMANFYTCHVIYNSSAS